MNALYGFLNRVAKVLIDSDPDTKQNLAALDGKVLCLDITSPQFTLYLLPGQHGVQIVENCDSEPSVTLSGPLPAFVRLATGGADSGVLSDGQVTMKGDADTGQAFQRVVSQLDLDGEELLSNYVGDTPARKIGNLARYLGQWAARTGSLSAENVADYLTEEKQVLVTPVAMERLENSINQLRADVDRIEQRLSKLTKPRR